MVLSQKAIAKCLFIPFVGPNPFCIVKVRKVENIVLFHWRQIAHMIYNSFDRHVTILLCEPENENGNNIFLVTCVSIYRLAPWCHCVNDLRLICHYFTLIGFPLSLKIPRTHMQSLFRFEFTITIQFCLPEWYVKIFKHDLSIRNEEDFSFSFNALK